MDERLIELYVQRGRLRERIGAQRQLIARELAPLAKAMGVADQGVAWLHRARAYVQAHPGVVAAVVVAVVVCVRAGYCDPCAGVLWGGGAGGRGAPGAVKSANCFARSGARPTRDRP